MKSDAKSEHVKKVLIIAERHFKKYGNRRMAIKELDALCEESRSKN